MTGLLLFGLGAPFSHAAQGNQGSLSLTPEEKSFLADKELRLGVDSARPPFEFIDEKGAYSGISAGFMEACLQRLGVRRVLVTGLNVGAAMKKLKEGEIDVIPKISPEPERAKDILFTKPHATFASVIVTRQNVRSISGMNDLAGLKVGVLQGLIVEERVKRDYPALELVLLPDARTALVDLSAGKIDVYIENMPIVAYNIDKLKLTNLKIAAQTPYIYDMAFGVRKDCPLLASALDKALASMSKEEQNAITNRWAKMEYQPGINWQAVAPMGGAFFLVIVFVLIWNRRLRRAVRERKRIEEELRENARMLETGGALKARLSQIAVELQKAANFEALAQTFMSQAAALTGFVYGAFYLLDEQAGLLRAVGGYGRMEAQTGLRHFEIGQGLVGQCALEKKPLSITDSESAQIRITWGGGHIEPGEILLLPVVQLDKLLAVIELGALKHFTSEQRTFLDDLMPTLALNIAILRRNLMTEELLAKSQAQALDLAVSEQQLRARKDELESQQQLLLAQRQELAAGKDALAQTAQELEDFNRVMIGRESRVIELKEEINALCARLGIPPTYPPVWDEAAASPGQGQEV